MTDSFIALLLGTFLAETVKNAAKSSANWLGSNGQSLFYPELELLGLNESATSEEITQQLEKRPDVREIVVQKVEAGHDDVKEMFEIIKLQMEKRSGITNNVSADNIENVFNQPSGTFNFTHNK